MTEWNQYQEDIFADQATGEGHTMVVARAGTGKTTTIKEVVRRVPSDHRVLLTAFNKAIAATLQKSIPSNASAKTLHGLGLAALYGSGAKVTVDPDKGVRIARKVADEAPSAKVRPLPRGVASAVRRGASLCKSHLATNKQEIGLTLDLHDVDADPHVGEDELVDLVWNALGLAATEDSAVDFDDMIWLPIVKKIEPKWGYDRVFVDEAQDMCAAQLELACMHVRANTRACFVGDPAQTIYAWRGADSERMKEMAVGLGMRELPLSVSYRCAKSIIREAQKYVPDIEWAPDAREGNIRVGDLMKMRGEMRAGDFVLSRSNAPLVKECVAAIRAGRKATILGRDLGTRLIAIVEKLTAKSVEDLLERVENWKMREIERRIAKDRPYQHIADIAACIEAFAEDAGSVDSVVQRIGAMFGAGDEKGHIILSTTHRAKGLESDRVFVLRDTYLKPRPTKANGGKPVEWDTPQEEKNLYYVAVTRARHELLLMTGLPE